MIIDLILDRKDGNRYTDDDRFYLLDEARFFGFDSILIAIDNNDNAALQRELCDYCREYMHGVHFDNICNYINSVNWII